MRLHALTQRAIFTAVAPPLVKEKGIVAMKMLSIIGVAMFALMVVGFLAAHRLGLNPAWAQSGATTYAVVVAACGTPPSTYAAGETRPVLQDVNGNVCAGAGP